MKAVATFLVLFLLAACGTLHPAMPGFLGTYDLVSFGTRPVPNPEVGRLWMEVSSQGTWEMFEEPRTRFGGTRGVYVVADTVEGCVRVNMWTEVSAGARAPMQFCPEEGGFFAYLNPLWLRDLSLDGSMTFKKRQ